MLADRLRKFTYFSGEIPTTEELELLKEGRERTGLVIRARWVLLGILAAYGIFPYICFQDISADLGAVTAVHCVVPVIAWTAMAVYNAWLYYTYKSFSKIRSFNQIQLLFDMLFVTVVVHFSGGAVSWFWTMYMVLTLEAAMIMDKDSDTFAIALGGILAYGGLLMFEFYGLIRPLPMPFENNALQQIFPYVIIKWAWVSITNLCVAFTAVFMMRTIRQREEYLRELVIKDNLTSLYNRRYFFYRLNSEIQRAKRYQRTLSLLILDVDDFKRINDRYGHLAGDALLRVLAQTILANIRRSDGTPSYEVDIACRYGGEEFALIFPEGIASQGAVAGERIRSLIEKRCGVEMGKYVGNLHGKTDGEKMRVTVSIGVASFPEHASDLEGLVREADNAMYTAKRAGKNRVIVAETPSPAPQAKQEA